MGVHEKSEEENLAMNMISVKAPTLESIALAHHIEETIEYQLQAQVEEIMEVQVHIQKVQSMVLLPLEDKCLPSS